MNDIKIIMSELEEKTELLKALAHPVRLGIVKRLIEKGCCNVNTVKDHLNMPQSTVSHYLIKLRKAGVIEGSRTGTVINYCVTNENVKKLISALFY